MTVKRLNPTTVVVDNLTFVKTIYNDEYVCFGGMCTDAHQDSLELFLACEESETYKPTAIELLLDIPICNN